MANLFIKSCAAIAVAVTLGSCASTQRSAALMGITDNTIHTCVAADLDYANAKRVEGSVEMKHVFGIPCINNGNKTIENTTRYPNLNKQKQQALYRAKEAAGVDIILEPEFETERHKWFFGLVTKQVVKVTGWGVNIKGFYDDETVHGHK